MRTFSEIATDLDRVTAEERRMTSELRTTEARASELRAGISLANARRRELLDEVRSTADVAAEPPDAPVR